MHTRDDLSCTRGYEGWLISEAKKRNPGITTYGLSWATPRWVGDGQGNGTGFHSPDNWVYQTKWLECIRNTTGYSVDWMGTWNEKTPGPPGYVTGLRAAFDAAGFAGTQISVYDGDWSTGDVVAEALADPAFAASFSSVGRHYPCVMPFPAVEAEIHKKYWASEDSSASNDWAGASCWARLLNRNYVYNNMTATIAWSLIWAAPAGLPFLGAGLMTAVQPWSGHYSGGDGGGPPSAAPSLDGPLWTTAHTTQFTRPGWRYLLTGSGSGLLPGGGGSFVTLVPPADLSALTIVIEKVAGPCKCSANATPAPADGVVTFALAGGLPGPGTRLQVWRTSAAAQFVRDAADAAVAADGTLSVFVAADTVVTLSTLAGAGKGAPPAPPPPPAPFPLPYADDFSGYPEDAAPLRLWADQTGSFAARGGAMAQVVGEDPGPNRWVREDLDPITLLGDATLAADVVVAVGATFAPARNASGAGSAALGFTYVQACARVLNYTGLRTQAPPGYCVGVNATGAWAVRAGGAALGGGQLPVPFSAGSPHALVLAVRGARVAAWVVEGAPPPSGALPGSPPLVNVTDGTFPGSGMVALGSGFHPAAFDNFTLAAA